jgi:hypothetical protein
MKISIILRFCFLAVIFTPYVTVAQEKHSFASIDSLSYKAYLDEDWKMVLHYSRAGFDSGYDYYFLRMRAGIAELNRHKPFRAESHFRKALVFSQNDPNALEYLYSSLLYSGQYAESRLLAAYNSPAFKKRLGKPARRMITSAFIEPGYLFNSKAGDIRAHRPDGELAHIYFVPAYWYVSAGINLESGRRFSGTLAANILSFKAFQHFIYRNQEPLVFEVPFEQKALYLAGNYYLGRGFHVTLAGQYMGYTYPVYQWVTKQTGGDYVMKTYPNHDLAFNASLTKQLRGVTLSFTADVNRFKDQWYQQAGTELVFYPAGNVDTWIKAGGTWVTGDNGKDGRIIAHGMAGFKLFRSLYLEGTYYFGDIRNFSEQNAYVVFNNFDLIRRRMGINLLAYRLRPRLDVSLRYQYSVREATWQIYTNSEYSGDDKMNYPVQSIIGGLTWRF